MSEQPKVKKEHCNKCLRWTNHTLLHSERTDWSEEIDNGMEIGGWDIWELIRCNGCESVRLKHRAHFSEDVGEDGGPVVTTEYFPPTVTRQKPIWRRNAFPWIWALKEYDGLLDEIYGALAQGSYRLAAMGIRALAERLMIDQVGDQGSFEKNISAFFAAGHVAPNLQGMFQDTLIEAGHAAMHRNFEPTADTINTLLDIIESVMHTVYYAPVRAEEAKRTIPPRA